MKFEDLYYDYWGKILTLNDYEIMKTLLEKEQSKGYRVSYNHFLYSKNPYYELLTIMPNADKTITIALIDPYKREKVKKLSHYTLFTKQKEVCLGLENTSEVFLNIKNWKEFLIEKFEELGIEIPLPKSSKNTIQLIKNIRNYFGSQSKGIPILLDSKTMAEVIYG